MNKIAFLLIGVTGSGKSTIIKHIKDQKIMLGGDPDIRIYSQDDGYADFCAANHTGQYWSDIDTDKDIYRYQFKFMTENEPAFKKFMEVRWREALKGDAVFVDLQNLTRKARARWCAELRQKGFTIWGIQIATSLQTLIERQSNRKDKMVPLDIVRRNYFIQQEVLVPDEVDFLFMVDGTAEKPHLLSTVHF